jgi:hypothetical protein
VYNIVKRAAQGPSGFAASSFANNGAGGPGRVWHRYVPIFV